MNNEIREFSTEELKAEIRRRELAYKTWVCWYCDRNLTIHNCKFAVKDSLIHLGWEFKEPAYIREEDCMAQEVEYWKMSVYNAALGETLTTIGDSKLEVMKEIINKIQEFK